MSTLGGEGNQISNGPAASRAAGSDPVTQRNNVAKSCRILAQVPGHHRRSFLIRARAVRYVCILFPLKYCPSSDEVEYYSPFAVHMFANLGARSAVTHHGLEHTATLRRDGAKWHAFVSAKAP